MDDARRSDRGVGAGIAARDDRLERARALLFAACLLFAADDVGGVCHDSSALPRSSWNSAHGMAHAAAFCRRVCAGALLTGAGGISLAVDCAGVHCMAQLALSAASAGHHCAADLRCCPGAALSDRTGWAAWLLRCNPGKQGVYPLFRQSRRHLAGVWAHVLQPAPAAVECAGGGRVVRRAACLVEAGAIRSRQRSPVRSIVGFSSGNPFLWLAICWSSFRLSVGRGATRAMCC